MNWENLLRWDSKLLSKLSPLSLQALYEGDRSLIHSYPGIHKFVEAGMSETPLLMSQDSWENFYQRSKGLSSFSRIPTGAELIEQYLALPPVKGKGLAVTTNAQALLLNKSVSTTGFCLDFLARLGLATKKKVDYPLDDLITSEQMTDDRMEKREHILPDVYAFSKSRGVGKVKKKFLLDLFSMNVENNSFIGEWELKPRRSVGRNLLDSFNARTGLVNASVLEQMIVFRQEALIKHGLMRSSERKELRNGKPRGRSFTVLHSASGLDDSYPVAKQIPLLGVTPRDRVSYPSIHLDTGCRGELSPIGVLNAVHYEFATTPKKKFSLDDLGGRVSVDVDMPDPDNFVLGPNNVWDYELQIFRCERCGEKVLPTIVR
ncbi:MAG: hypothetical protein GOU97_03665 [Nanoarchaeota archaeon]|nr:hypothetical protein [Nanoarchaeota archaeon]